MVLLLCRSADGVSFDSLKNALRVPVLSLRYERYSLCAPRGIVSALQRYSVSDIITEDILATKTIWQRFLFLSQFLFFVVEDKFSIFLVVVSFSTTGKILQHSVLVTSHTIFMTQTFEIQGDRITQDKRRTKFKISNSTLTQICSNTLRQLFNSRLCRFTIQGVNI